LRTCYFGIAHVDTPKGDLNGDGMVSGPLTSVITGSEVYPWGTTEQYPNSDANEGHFYMECSNKGICDRKTGICECFDGYEGTACVRASCPSDCTDHGTCETIRELAAFKGYNTNENVDATTSAAGAVDDFDLAVEESYSYDLWDHDKTMGCKCDPGFYGADCSIVKCKYGVDPLFYDDTDGVIYQTTVVHLGSVGTMAADIGGTFNIIFYDVFGEKYITKPIDARPMDDNGDTAPTYGNGITTEKVKEALEALPNGVIEKANTDVTRVGAPAVRISMQSAYGELTKSGGIGAGTSDNVGARGVGTGTWHGHGPEFTITFSTNPGILKTIELDTAQITNQGITDYWVANMRQGQFRSRYTTNLGRVNTLIYGSKYLYTNEDLTSLQYGGVVANDLVKVGGQEFMIDSYTFTVTGSDPDITFAPYSLEASGTVVDPTSTFRLTLSEPFLGTSIIPILTDTGAVATSIGTGGFNDHTGAADRSDAGFPDNSGFPISWANSQTSTDYLELVTSTVTSANTDSLVSGTDLFVQGCPLTSMQNNAKMQDQQAYLEIFHTECQIDFVNGGNNVIYRRSDDPSNQNLYQATTDTAVWASQQYCFMRGAVDVYPCEMTGSTAISTPTAATFSVGGSRGNTQGLVTKTSDNGNSITNSGSIYPYVFLDNLGPYAVVSSLTTTVTIEAAEHSDFTKHWEHSTYRYIGINIYKVIDDMDNLASGAILLINGRRYRVTGAQSTVAGSYGGIRLSETYAGSAYMEMCSNCVDEVSNDSSNSVTGSDITIRNDWGYGIDLYAGEQLMVGGASAFDTLMPVAVDVHDCEVGCDIKTTSSAGGGGIKVPTIASGAARALYKVINTNGYTPIIVTESKYQSTYQYVSQCSNRGTCNNEAGICLCYKGYTNDNCDTQNMLAA
jgi:hypothetical protein